MGKAAMKSPIPNRMALRFTAFRTSADRDTPWASRFV